MIDKLNPGSQLGRKMAIARINHLTIQNSKFKIKDIFKRGFKPRWFLSLRRSRSVSQRRTETGATCIVGVLNPLIDDKFSASLIANHQITAPL